MANTSACGYCDATGKVKRLVGTAPYAGGYIETDCEHCDGVGEVETTTPPTVSDALEKAEKVCRDRADAVYDHAKGPYLECVDAIAKLREELK